MVETAFSEGLEGVIAGTTSICSMDGTLRYRGYAVEDLAEHATFEEVAFLLLHGDLPRQKQAQEFSSRLMEDWKVPEPVLQALRALPQDSSPMDGLRSGVSLLGSWDGLHGAQPETSVALLAKMPALLAALNGRAPEPPAEDKPFAFQLLRALSPRLPGDLAVRVFEISLILYAEHEFNASAFAARLTASTLSDYYSSMVSAIGTLKGPLHGGANEEVMRMLLRIGEADKAQAFVEEALASKRKIMGFGHRVYKHGDPRAPILRSWGLKLGEQTGEIKWFKIAKIVEETVQKHLGLYPNLDFPSAVAYFVLGIPIPFYTPVFAASRLTGWSAHFMEQRADNRLIRPRALYQGPAPRPYQPIYQR